MNEKPKMTAPSAYRIEQAMSAWQSARARLFAEDPDLAHDEAALVEILGPEQGDVRDILARLLRGAAHAAMMASGADDYIDQIKARRDRYKRRGENMRATAFAVMDAIGEPKVELPDLTASMRKGAAQVVITDENAIPDRFKKTEFVTKIDKPELLAALKDGEVIDGAELANGIPSLTIRTK